MFSISTRIGSRLAVPGNRFLATSTLASMATQVASVACSALLGIFLARTLGAAGYGDFTYAYTLLLIAVIPAKLGLDTAAMKLVAAYEKSGDHPRTHGILRYATGRSLLVGTIVSVWSLLILFLRRDSLPDQLYWCMIAAALSVPALALLHILQYVLYGLRRYILALLPESILRPLFLILVVFLVAAAHGRVSAAQALFFNFILTVLLVVGAWALLRKLLPRETLASTPLIEAAEWRRTGSAMLMISGLNFVLAQTDIVLLGIFAGTYEAGLYSAAARIALLVLFFYSAINSVVAPVISRAHVAGDKEEMHRLASTCARVILSLTILVAAISIIFGKSLLWLFGDAFVQAYPVLVVLTLAQVVKALSGIGGFLLTMTDQEGASARLSFAGAICNLLVALAVIPRFGAMGAAYSTLLATVVWSAGVIFIVRKRVGISCWS